MKLLEVKGNDDDADIPELRETGVIIVSGYDIGLAHDDVVRTLRKHFSPCGEITDVFVGKCGDKLNRCASIYFWGKSSVDKALLLNGRDLGVWKARVEPKTIYDFVNSSALLCVSGFDASLDIDDIKIALTKHFSSCGTVERVVVLKSANAAMVSLEGKNATHKALKLGVTSIQGRKVVIKLVSRPINPTRHRRRLPGHRRMGNEATMTAE